MTNLSGTIARITGVLFLLGFNNPLFSAEITVSLPGGIVANADFRKGESGRPVVFLLHGFMSTHTLNIIQLMSEELENQGFAVLAPTLSLNINNRRTGANCEAIHTHTMESDVKEIAWWVNWLKDKGYKNVIMAGFSTGSLQIAIFLAANKNDIIKKAVLVSPAYLAGAPFSPVEEKADIITATEMLAKHELKLNNFHLSYCNGNFVAPPEVFLSYKKWTSTQLLKVTREISIPYTVISGEEDHRFGIKLAKEFKKINTPLVIIPGANHFFDSPNEFDFLDKFIRVVAEKN